MFPFDPPENPQRFSDVFRGIKREHWKKKGLIISYITGCCVVDSKKPLEKLKKLVLSSDS